MDTKKSLILVAGAVLIIAGIAGGYYVSRQPFIAPSAAQNHTVTDLSGRTTVTITTLR